MILSSSKFIETSRYIKGNKSTCPSRDLDGYALKARRSRIIGILTLLKENFMSETMEAAHHCSPSLTLSTASIYLFRASLLCLSLVSTFYLHPSLSLPLISSLAFSISFQYSNITFLYRKMASYGGSTQSKTKHDDDKIFTTSVAKQDEDGCKVHDGSEVKLCSSQKESHSLISCAGYCVTDSEMRSSSCSSASLYDELDEDYVIEISLPPELRPCFEDKRWHKSAESVYLEDFLADVNEIMSGEDGLIEIDISMGLIRN